MAMHPSLHVDASVLDHLDDSTIAHKFVSYGRIFDVSHTVEYANIKSVCDSSDRMESNVDE